MQLGWGLLTMVILAAAVLWFWQDSLAARESANAAAMEACGRLGLQFLDGTVAFARVALVREAGRLKLRRTYVFDYTATSIERRQGFVLLTGRRVESVGYAPGDTRADAAIARAEPLAPHDQATRGSGSREIPRDSNALPGGGNVLELRDWRERHDPATGSNGSREISRENAVSQPPRGPDDEAH